MGRKRKPITKAERKEIKIENEKNPLERTISREHLFHIHLYADVRKRLNKKVKELPNHQVRKIATLVLDEVANWLIDNPEGFRMPYDMGYLAISKYIMVPFREDRFEIVNKIKSLSSDSISERFREIILKKYGKRLDKVEAEIFLKQGKVITVPMWYNQRNCSIRKASVFKWLRNVNIKNKLRKSDKTKYHYYHFKDFYDYKIKSMDKFKI